MKTLDAHSLPAPADPAAPALRGALAALALAVLLAALGSSIASVALPELARAFTASFQAVQWIVIAYLLGITTVVVGVGRLGDMAGRRRLLLAGIALFTVASALAGVAPTLELLVAARALQGLGAAAMMALTLAIVGDAVPPARRGRSIGLLGTMSALGTALGPSLGGLLIAAAGWPAIFLVQLPLGVLALLLGWRCLPDDRPVAPDGRGGFDLPGTLLLALALAAYALAMTTGRGDFGPANLALLLAAAVAAGLFVRVERRAKAPLVRVATLREPRLGAGLAMSLLVSTVMMATLVVGPFHLALGLGLDATRVGLAVAAGPLVAALSAAPAGHLADRYGAARMSGIGLAGMAIGCGLLAALPTRFGVAAYVAPIVVVTASYALFQTANNTAVIGAADAAQRGAVSGMLNLSRNLGLITGASLMGAVFAWATAASDPATAGPDAIANGMHTSFAVATALLVVALAIGAGRNQPGKRSCLPRIESDSAD